MATRIIGHSPVDGKPGYSDNATTDKLGWRILPLLVIAIVLFGGGVAEAGVIDCVSGPDIQCVVPVRPWWDVITIILVLIITIFL